MQQCNFDEVSVNNKNPNPCSPSRPNPQWRGILINAPERVFYPAKESSSGEFLSVKVPICGYYYIEVPTEPTNSPLTLLVLDTETGETYSERVTDTEPHPKVSKSESDRPDPEKIKGLISGSYFNPNLTDFVKLPEKKAVYEVHVSFAGHESNKVIIRVFEEI